MEQIEKENLFYFNNTFNPPNKENKYNMNNQSNKPHIYNKQNKNKAKIKKLKIYNNNNITYFALFLIIFITIINQTTSRLIRGISFLSNSYIIKIKINSSGQQRVFFKGRADNGEI